MLVVVNLPNKSILNYVRDVTNVYSLNTDTIKLEQIINMHRLMTSENVNFIIVCYLLRLVIRRCVEQFAYEKTCAHLHYCIAATNNRCCNVFVRLIAISIRKLYDDRSAEHSV